MTAKYTKRREKNTFFPLCYRLPYFRLCGDVDRHGQHGVRVSHVHRPGGQRHGHDRQHRPGSQGVQEQGP